MYPLANFNTLTNSDPDCDNLAKMAERELTAFFHAVRQLFGAEEAELAAEDWLEELNRVSELPASHHDWRSFIAKVSTQVAARMKHSRLPITT